MSIHPLSVVHEPSDVFATAITCNINSKMSPTGECTAHLEGHSRRLDGKI